MLFATGSSELDSDSRARLHDYADCIARRETHVLFISGSTDPSGGTEHNAALARARGRAVADYLEAAGCRMDFEIRAFPEDGSLRSREVWPLERSATVSVHPPRH